MKGRSDNKEVIALHHQDLHKTLDRWGLLERFLSGDILCEFSRDVITNDNLGAIFPKDGEVKFVCSNLRCLSRLSSER